MASQVTRDEVARIAALARLELSEEERGLFARQLTDILAYAAVLQEADTTGVPAPDAAPPGDAGLRADTPGPSLDRDAVLAAAPDADRASGLFRVPKVR